MSYFPRISVLGLQYHTVHLGLYAHALRGSRERGAGSAIYPGVDGYPVVLPLPLSFDRDKRCFTLPILHQKPVSASGEQVSLTLLHYDEQIKGERYLLFYGHVTETGKEWTFTPSQVVIRQWGRRA